MVEIPTKPNKPDHNPTKINCFLQMQSSFVDENTTVEELNEDFNHNMMLTKSLMGCLPSSGIFFDWVESLRLLHYFCGWVELPVPREMNT